MYSNSELEIQTCFTYSTKLLLHNCLLFVSHILKTLTSLVAVAYETATNEPRRYTREKPHKSNNAINMHLHKQALSEITFELILYKSQINVNGATSLQSQSHSLANVCSPTPGGNTSLQRVQTNLAKSYSILVNLLIITNLGVEHYAFLTSPSSRITQLSRNIFIVASLSLLFLGSWGKVLPHFPGFYCITFTFYMTLSL